MIPYPVNKISGLKMDGIAPNTSLDELIKQLDPSIKTNIPNDVDRIEMMRDPYDYMTTQCVAIVSASLLLVIALTWKDVGMEIMQKMQPHPSISNYLIFALIVTLLLGLMIYLLNRYFTEEGRKLVPTVTYIESIDRPPKKKN